MKSTSHLAALVCYAMSSVAAGADAPPAMYAKVQLAERTIGEILEPTVRKVIEHVKKDRHQSITIRRVTISPESLEPPSGNLLRLAMKSLFEKEITVKRGAKCELKGDVELSDDRKQVDFQFTVTGQKEPFRTSSADPVLLGLLMGENLEIPDGKTEVEISDAVQDKLTDRDQGSAQSNIEPDTEREIRVGEYGLQVLLLTAGDGELIPAPVRQDPTSKIPFVSVREGQEFAIKVLNYDAKYDAAIELFVDGVPFNYHLPESDRTFWLIRRGDGQTGSELFEGWLKSARSDGEGERFIVGKFEDSVAKTVGIETDKVGTISVLIRRAWNKGENQTQGNTSSHGIGKGSAYKSRQPPLSSMSERFPRCCVCATWSKIGSFGQVVSQ